jgi:hypothetical protein
MQVSNITTEEVHVKMNALSSVADIGDISPTSRYIAILSAWQCYRWKKLQVFQILNIS